MTLIVKITSYNKKTNTCQAVTDQGVAIVLDPFVGCAIDMTDEEYKEGFGYSVIGNTYCITYYTSQNNHVTPHEGGMIFLYADNSK